MPNMFDTSGNTVQETAATSIASGQFAFENTVAKFYSGGDTTVAGQPIAPYVGGVTIQIIKDTITDVFAVGVAVYGDETAQTALISGPGDGQLGICAKASAATDAHVIVRMTN